MTQLHRQTYTARPDRLKRRQIVNGNDSVLQQKGDSIGRSTPPPCEKCPCNQPVGVRSPQSDCDAAGLRADNCAFLRVKHRREIAGSQWLRTAHPDAGERDDCPQPAPVAKGMSGSPSKLSHPRVRVLSQVACCQPSELRMRIACIRNPERLYPAAFRSVSFLVPELEARLVQNPVVAPTPSRSGSRLLCLAPGPVQPAQVSPAVSLRGDPRRVLPSYRCDVRSRMRVRGNGRTMGALAVNLP